ncbi:ergothioneine biosynthesis glutamate--cysteine ligase EgtA [Nocardia flavorosea]|uniref:ergothioneine biosynthesis glutamate--cysteine ligase EgtA n=1 Tax=Nocardia flavorosea TaxID=53429 RepID=UPI001895D292|nr:ergothioneine biosynthesis glutamate--cysteine ligase EgtA [Nocardia flavorosea]MBF6350505.1 ergothioneine biosynthesis glutamate--cysteine ligase EgtA [Nocardia flavorosea]
MAVTLEHPESASDSSPHPALSSRAAAEAFLGGVCFKLGPPMLIGAELEWFTVHRPGTAAGRGSFAGRRPTAALLAQALGPHAPHSIAPDSPAEPLSGGSRVTVEPGGQIELSSVPVPDPAELCARLGTDYRRLRELLDSRSIRMVSAAADPARAPRCQLRLPRYQAMEDYFGRIGPFGRLMMSNTAAAQISVDIGADRTELTARWTALHALGPALIAAFACSPVLRGAPSGEWASQRMRTWLHLDPARACPPVADWSDPITGYARWALDAPLLCVRRCDAGPARPGVAWRAPEGATFADWLSGGLDDELGRRPNLDDLRYHLTTLFPPVRPAGYFEIRYLDAQPGEDWKVPIAVLHALLSTPAAVADATAAAAGTTDRWLDAARHGLADPQLRAAAVALLEVAIAHSGAPAPELHAALHRCAAGAQPAGIS